MSESTRSESTSRIYRVTGMTCEHCARAVTQEVGSIDAVTDVHVDLGTGDVTVNSTRPLTTDEINAALFEAGYDLAS